jgi:hypothetical protein
VKLRMGRFPAAVLAACTLGVLSFPVVFAGLGALSELQPGFVLVITPPWLLASGFLAWRFLARPNDRPARGAAGRIGETLSWCAIVGFAFFASSVRLTTGLERWGACCTLFLVASAVCLPLVLMRRTALEQRLARLPVRMAVLVLVLVLAISGLSTIRYLVNPPAFI